MVGGNLPSGNSELALSFSGYCYIVPAFWDIPLQGMLGEYAFRLWYLWSDGLAAHQHKFVPFGTLKFLENDIFM